jgi:hypothetical protein
MIEHLKGPLLLRLFIANGGTSTIWVAGVFITVGRSIFCQLMTQSGISGSALVRGACATFAGEGDNLAR